MNDWSNVVPGTVFYVSSTISNNVNVSMKDVEKVPLWGIALISGASWHEGIANAMMKNICFLCLDSFTLQDHGIGTGSFHEEFINEKQKITATVGPLTAIARENVVNENIICITPKCSIVVVSSNISFRCHYQSSKVTTSMMIVT